MSAVTLHCGDARDVLATLPDASVDAVITDPPYALTDKQGGSKGFMGARWDTGQVAHDPAFWAEVLRVAKPGAFLLAFGGTRTYHRLACAIEDAGWELRDMIVHWLYGSGFPKSASCLKPSQEPIVLAKAPGPLQPLQIDACRVATGEIGSPRAYEPRQDREQWRITGGSNGSGATSSAGRWPPNTLLSHVGGPDGCQPAGVQRVRGSNGVCGASTHVYGNGKGFTAATGEEVGYADADGYESVDAWTCVDGCPIKALDEQAGPRTSGANTASHNKPTPGWRFKGTATGHWPANTGSASRFFPTFPGPDPADAVPFRYVPKASRREREAGLDGAEPATKTIYGAGITSADHPGTADGGGPRPARNHHPCVKPRDLMAWLVTLVTVPGGVVLDPFCGSGSTGVACVKEGFGFIGIEMSEEYAAIAHARIAHEQEQRSGPLFAGVSAAAAR